MESAAVCVICGAPFALEAGIYHLDPNRAEYKWLRNVRIIGPANAFKNHCMNVAPDNQYVPSQNGVVVSDTVSWSITDADCFRLHDLYYRVLEADESGDVLFPLHDKCIQLAERAFEFQCINRARTEAQTHTSRLYDALKGHYLEAVSTGVSMYQNPVGLVTTCDLLGYRAEDLVDDIGPWSGGFENYLSDPIDVEDCTERIASYMLKRIDDEPAKSPSFEIRLPQKQYHGIEALPNEILDQIVSKLPARAVIALHCSSKILASNIIIDNNFWRDQLLHGSSLSHIWDLHRVEIEQFISFEATWDWKRLTQRLAAKPIKVQTVPGCMPRGLWNRRRIFERIEGVLTQPPKRPVEVRSGNAAPAKCQKKDLSASFLKVPLFVMSAVLIACHLRY